MYIIRFFLWLFSLIADITNEFIEKNVPLLSAAISFYAFFSIFPLLLAIIMVFSIFLGLPDFEKTILDSLKNLIPIFDEKEDLNSLAIIAVKKLEKLNSCLLYTSDAADE